MNGFYLAPEGGLMITWMGPYKTVPAKNISFLQPSYNLCANTLVRIDQTLPLTGRTE